MSLIKRIAQLHIQAHSFDRVIYSPKPITKVRAVAQITLTSLFMAEL